MSAYREVLLSVDSATERRFSCQLLTGELRTPR